MQSYSVRDIERVLQLSRSAIRSLVDGGFVKPTRGPRREYRFSFQDLVVLRAARSLMHAQVSPRRIHRSLRDLRRHLPAALPLSGLSICAVGDRVVVREGASHWEVDRGQYLLGLDVRLDDGILRVSEWKDSTAGSQQTPGNGPANAPTNAPADAPEGSDALGADEWFENALGVESTDPLAALDAYQRAIGLEPDLVAAWINWGRLLHALALPKDAESVYRRALQQCGPDSLLLFNLGVLLEEQGRTEPALDAYQRAIGEDPNLADCHYNLARLYESLGKPQHAIRHFGQYRRLLISESR